MYNMLTDSTDTTFELSSMITKTNGIIMYLLHLNRK